jgi:uncharacterized protein (TIGR02996 family)
MTQDESFLEAIRAEPDEDAVRLIYADWLMEQDEPSRVERGEFIRLQVEHARLAPNDVKRKALIDQERTLLGRNWKAWIGPLSDVCRGLSRDVWMHRGYRADSIAQFSRGFVKSVSVHAPDFLTRVKDLLRLTPLDHLQITGANSRAVELAGCFGLASIQKLDFVDYFVDPLDAAGMRELARSPHLGRLRELDLYRNNLGDEGVAALVTAGWLAQLNYLNLSENGISDEGARLLAQSPLLSRLQSLGLERNELTAEGCRELRESPYLPRSAQVKLQTNPGCP